MLLVLLFSLFSVGFGMRVMRRELLKDQPTVLLLGPLEVLTSSSSEDDTPDFPSLRDKRGVDPMSIPRLIKEPPLKKRSGDFKRGDVVYPSAAKQTVPLVRVREPPLKRGQMFLEELLQFNDDAHRQFMDPLRRIRYGPNRLIYTW
ncbi:Neuropeptide-like protein 68 [Caenorhabditis elegans]|uniref:Neuropeptide-like protein 68 n=1 Tax=Caenorhabditis elegans TaxID=6239 RepID=NLP68_CAEEL|nr:Neuropeptide-like protein 68 [Caenorhabditis elegans]Q22634.3 RecName: Full=Neuropeptide-like protein 68; Flags: Precursor [Caenorhabditis elegans]AAG50219.1 3K628 [Caenorhabditis elegans]CAA90316.2 Neuropeptide-like protein 68 [Caenorhabditis elegans]|eukprot:NP_499325.1 Neuropeptide-like protein 68 [Caenorhabditis elegans]